MVTHDPRAAAIADRILYLADGMIVLEQQGATAVGGAGDDEQARFTRSSVIRIALKDLLGRKLRLVLTSLAIVMGVAMISGTFVLTDTINAGFSVDLLDRVLGLRRGRHGQGGLRRLAERAVLSGVDARPGPSPPGCGGRGRRSRRPRAVRRPERQGDRRAAARRGSRSARHGPATSASTRSRSPAAPGRPARGRWRSTRTRRTICTSSVGRHGRVAAAERPGAPLPGHRDRRVRRTPRSAAPRSRSSTCRPRRRSSTSRASSTRSTRRRSRGSRTRPC